jgi:hypothetical protein
VTFQHSSVKGCLELKGYAVSVSEKKSHTFIVSNLRDMNYYELTATTDESMNQWVEHIRASIQQATDNEALGRSGDQPLVRPPPLLSLLSLRLGFPSIKSRATRLIYLFILLFFYSNNNSNNSKSVLIFISFRSF